METTTNPLLDPFDELLELEETFYQQGYARGREDGSQAGLVEGRAFGLDKGFDKFFAMSRIFGRAVVWGNRLESVLCRKLQSTDDGAANDEEAQPAATLGLDTSEMGLAPLMGPQARLEKHIRTLYALSEPDSLSISNDEDDVSEFDDRFKRAEAKSNIIGRIVGENAMSVSSTDSAEAERGSQARKGDVGIEDAEMLNTRH